MTCNTASKMRAMPEVEVLERKIQLREQHLLLILLDLQSKRERLVILKNKEVSDKGQRSGNKS